MSPTPVISSQASAPLRPAVAASLSTEHRQSQGHGPCPRRRRDHRPAAPDPRGKTGAVVVSSPLSRPRPSRSRTSERSSISSDGLLSQACGTLRRPTSSRSAAPLSSANSVSAEIGPSRISHKRASGACNLPATSASMRKSRRAEHRSSLVAVPVIGVLLLLPGASRRSRSEICAKPPTQ